MSVFLILLCHRAQEQLALINQVFQDVLKSEETRRHYDQLCRFRQVCTITLWGGGGGGGGGRLERIISGHFQYHNTISCTVDNLNNFSCTISIHCFVSICPVLWKGTPAEDVSPGECSG